jgi:A/G-specific adenine glycosylase
LALPSVEPRRAWLARRLLAWFREHRRDLPWRRSRDPYRVWVAEMMLQQTRVATAVPYFERFVSRFPDLASLARAPLDDVLKAWEGLGYYRRAQAVKRTAELLVADGERGIPADFDRLLALPGIGRYTAGAVMSLGFNQPYPIQDGNVRRVLCRLWAVGAKPQSATVQRWLWSAAERLIPRGRAGEFNEALMELGATVCTDRAPRCADCPLRRQCDACASGVPTAFPRPAKARPLPHYDVVAAIIQRAGRVLVTKRKSSSMLGGLWEFPGGKIEPGESAEQCLHREIAEELGIEVRIDRAFVRVKHAYSHFRITLHTFLCRHRRGRARALGSDGLRWARPAELQALAFPKADRVVLAALLRESPWSKVDGRCHPRPLPA